MPVPEADVEDDPLSPQWQPPASNVQPGPSLTELQLIGAHQSVSFKKSISKHGLFRPLTTLPPFVPRLLKDEIAANDAKYRSFDHANMKELTQSSKSLTPCMYEFQGSVMIADVKGFTQLTEILSKKGAPCTMFLLALGACNIPDCMLAHAFL